MTDLRPDTPPSAAGGQLAHKAFRGRLHGASNGNELPFRPEKLRQQVYEYLLKLKDNPVYGIEKVRTVEEIGRVAAWLSCAPFWKKE